MLSAIVLGLVGVLSVTAMQASGPRWVTGPPYFTGKQGVPVVWSNMTPLYFTDPGDLSPWVNHAAADALVAAAVGVWNVPTALIEVAQGGTLAEHVSGANSYLSADGPVFPADVQSGNSAAVQIAVIYDSDGSVTDMLLGGGASSPLECRQNGVTESVDSITPAGFIQHAVLVLNGRCTGKAPEQQLQLQYQLERAVGRILGVGWAQTNDNVFTRTPQPTNNQALHWPIMHPIDIVCGAYTYQCLPQPFTLRDDDIAAITSLYVMWIDFRDQKPPLPPGKIWSYTNASRMNGTVTFPTGQGMQGVNLVVQRREPFWEIPEAWYDSSSVTGFLYRQDAGNPVTGPGTGLSQSMGSTDPQWEGYWELSWIPIMYSWYTSSNVLITTEAINPLYIGSHAVGPYGANSVDPSGASQTQYEPGIYTDQFGWSTAQMYFAPPDAANSCATPLDGTEQAPAAVQVGGWWNGLVCSQGHTAWSSFTMRAGRTASVEVTALDEQGYATTAKAMPLIGLWSASDALGQLPTVASTQSPFNSVSLGMTSLPIASGATQTLRLAIADARGDGRPDFAYRARVLYADSLQPAVVSANGGQITISGMGFRAGNQVKVNGVSAVVSSWNATTIVAVAPIASAFKVSPALPVDIEVIDLSTGGTTTMTAALTYGNILADVMTLVSAPTGSVAVGTPSAFAVRVFLGDGVTPVAGLPVTFSATGAAVKWGGCSAAPCVVLTDATGLASTTVTPTAFGSVSLQAAAVGVTVAATFNAVAQSVAMVRPLEYIAAGATVAWSPKAIVIQNGTAATGTAVTWTASAGMVLSPLQNIVDAQGFAQVTATTGPLAAGVGTAGQACAWTAPAVCANFGAVGVDPAAFRLVVVSGAGQQIASTGTFAPVVMMVTDGSGDPVAGATVTIHQTVDAAEMPCPARGRCPTPPVLGASTSTGVSDADGLISVTPTQIPGVAELTNIAVATGTQGFASLSIVQGP